MSTKTINSIKSKKKKKKNETMIYVRIAKDTGNLEAVIRDREKNSAAKDIKYNTSRKVSIGI